MNYAIISLIAKKSLVTHERFIHNVKYGCDQFEIKYPELESLKNYKTLVHGGRQYIYVQNIS